MEHPPRQGGDLQDTHAPQVSPHSQGGEHQHVALPPAPHPETYIHQSPEYPPLPPPEDQASSESPDEQVICQGIEQAHQTGTEIDDRTARYIASQLHEGQTSALYSLASSGAIAETVLDELTRDFDQQAPHVQTWITWLGRYCLNREDKGPVPGWATSAAAIDRAEADAQAPAEDEAQARQDLMRRISAAGVTTLSRIATIVTGSPAHEYITADHQHEPHREYDEPDDFPWHDAARRSPDDQAAETIQDQLDLLFSETPTEAIGSVEYMGWFGLLTQEGQAGGIILSQNAYGFRHAWATASDEALTQQWHQLQCEHEAFTTATRAHRSSDRSSTTGDSHIPTHDRIGENDTQRHEGSDTTTTEREVRAPEDTPSGHYPEIWVGSLSDYTNGHLHGAWLDATLDADELHLAIQFILRHSYYPGAEEWAIMDYDDFCGLSLGEYESLAVVSRIAKGIAEHGEAFAARVGYVGERSEDLLTDERFQDHYLGHFDPPEVYAEYILEETDAYHYLDEIPESLRMYAKFDTEQMGRDMEIELYVVEADSGGIFIFDLQS